jgi:hypothetical protein
MTRQEITDVFLVRALPAERVELRRTLEKMSKQELEEAYKVLQLQATEERLLEIQAERAADKAMFELQKRTDREPQRKREEEQQLSVDRETFADAAKTLRSFALNEANFTVIRSVLGPNFTTYSIQQAIGSNALELSPPTQQEQDEWARQEIEAHNLRLLNTDIPTLRKLAREAGAQIATRPAVPQLDETQRVRQAERSEGISYPPLPDEFRDGNNPEEVLDAAFIQKCSKETMRLLLKRYGADQVNEALRTRMGGVYQY